jgi:hypothetical protein
MRLARRLFSYCLFFVLIVGGLYWLSTQSRHPNKMSDLPQFFVWAWERPEDLRFIDPNKCGVAYFAQIITLRGDKVVRVPRMQPLQVSPQTALIAVTRIETDQSTKVSLSPEQMQQVSEYICALSKLPQVKAVQIDFDARSNERNFYRALIDQVRKQLPDSTGLSITALVSWCLWDNWIHNLPVDEEVPMFFRIGPEQEKIVSYFMSGKHVAHGLSEKSLGISTDEPQIDKMLPILLGGRRDQMRVYVFCPKSWTEQRLDETEKQIDSY